MIDSEALDSNFISILLTDVFGNDVLKMSSAGGKKSNYNNALHTALDETKLTFIKGCFRISSLFQFICTTMHKHENYSEI